MARLAKQEHDESSLFPQPKILIHLTLCCDPGRPEWFYNRILDSGPLTLDDCDVQAVSMYPYWGPENNFPPFKEMATFLKSTYGKEIQIVETNYPSVCRPPTYEWPADIGDIPISMEGQDVYLERMAAALEEVGGTGLNYWEPAWTQNVGLGSPCELAILFDAEGKAHESLSVFGRIWQSGLCGSKDRESIVRKIRQSCTRSRNGR